MRPSPRHEMVHKGTDAAGMEEWRCPVCGRHFIVRWPPDYERLVLAEGDGDATHVGTRDQVGLSGLEVARPAADDPTTQGDEDAWRRWLDEHGIDWDGTARPPEAQAVSAGSGGPAGSGSARRGRRNSAAATAPAATATAATM